MTPTATYRVQLRPGFGFAEVSAIAGYLQALGVSHVYLSPHLQAAPGSTHGYDVVDPSRVSDELGGPEAHKRMVSTLREHALGQVVDIVPNHMATATPQNRWWWDVLENGPASRYAGHFDVTWRGPDARLHDKVLMPILGDHYGRVLESSQIRIERHEREFLVRVYAEHVLPMAPRSLAPLLKRVATRVERSDELSYLADALSDLPDPGAADEGRVVRRQRDKAVLYALLSRLLADCPDVGRALDDAIAAVNADADALDAVIEAQNYRLAYWRVAAHDLDYRRFFDIDTLVGLCVERREVFDDTHGLVLQWVDAGEVDGLRVDHPDGLRDPTGYMQRLRGRAPGAWIVVEKILSSDETLPNDWPVDGTTGYDFLDVVGRLFVDPSAEAALRGVYDDFTGQPHPPFAELVREKKRLALEELLAGELNRLIAQLLEVCEHHPRYRDYTRIELGEALLELLCCLPVYRTYVRAGARVSERDRVFIHAATARAVERASGIDPRLLGFIERLLSGELDGPRERAFVARFQQLSGPAMAKGQEDTAFYCDHVLVSLNEVGGEPDHFGIALEGFHAHCRRIQRTHPSTMLATSTHDTKRSEDVRARISALSEVPAQWAEAVRRFRDIAAPYRREGLPDAEIEYLFYQVTVGAWPITFDRLEPYMLKAARESKVHTSWLRQNAEYEAALSAFVGGTLADSGFIGAVSDFVRVIEPLARRSSLGQLTLKMTVPGVPDLYQGNEIWRHDLTDPDNRRPVDFGALANKLERARQLTASAVTGDEDPDLLKLFVTHRLLDLRKRERAAFGPKGRYEPLTTRGVLRDHIVAFSRGGRVLVLVPRLVAGVGGDWRGTSVALPQGRFVNLFTEQPREGGECLAAELLGGFPVGVWTRSE